MKLNLSIVALLLTGLLLFPTTAHAQDECPAIPADGPGALRIEGQGIYSNYALSQIIVDQPVMALIDVGLSMQGDGETFPSTEGQVIGSLTSSFFTSPFSFTINLPAQGLGLQVDLDQDDQDEAGVQVYLVGLSQNMLNTVPLTGIAQTALLSSYYRDPVTEEIVQGAFLVYAPDDQQSFPCGYGPDGALFTEDDPIVDLPQGFTVASIADETITFDRSEVARVNVVEDPGSGTPDFSDQGFVGSFNTLIDFLRERYVFNDFYDIDWDEIYATYFPRVEEAEANESLADYYFALHDMALALDDAHVYVQPGDLVTTPEGIGAYKEGFARYMGGVGAEIVELDDGRIIVTSVKPGAPATSAGFEFGTEIVSVNGSSVEEALAQPLRTLDFPGTPEAKRAMYVSYLLKHPVGSDIEVGYRMPSATEVTTTTLTTVYDVPAQPESTAMPLEYSIMDGIGYVTWPSFSRTGIATHIFADFIKVMAEQQIPGIVIDMRNNTGGSAFMEFAILSYLFSEENPLHFSIADSYRYNELTGEFVREPKTNEFYAPPAARPYLGDVVVLVSTHCVSACEFMSYWLQASGRATVIGQYPTEGAGGSTQAVYLSNGIQFNYTASTDVDPETDMPTFQAVGVQPDIRVPVTEEIEREKLEGGDPILDAGIEHLRRLAFEHLGHEPAAFASGTVTSTVPTGWTPNEDGSQYASADDPISLSITTPGSTSTMDPDAIMVDIYPEIEKGGEIEADLGTWTIYGSEFNDTFNLYGVIVLSDQPYIVTASTTDEQLVALMAEFIFAPALRDFTVIAE